MTIRRSRSAASACLHPIGALLDLVRRGRDRGGDLGRQKTPGADDLGFLDDFDEQARVGVHRKAQTTAITTMARATAAPPLLRRLAGSSMRPNVTT